MDLLSSDDEDQRSPEDDLHRVAEEHHRMAEVSVEDHLIAEGEHVAVAEMQRRNWVKDTVCWKTHGNPNVDT